MSTSRRTFLKQVSATTLIAASPLSLHLVAAESAPPAMPPSSPGQISVALKINGHSYHHDVEPRVVLLDFLRETLALTGTKKGCDHGQCGACTVLINGRRIKSCLTLAVMHDGDEITTIEGLEENGALHPMQAAFLDHDGFQCGYCTAGQIMSAVALTREPIGADDADVREAMSGNLCRCGAYRNICAAIQSVRHASTSA